MRRVVLVLVLVACALAARAADELLATGVAMAALRCEHLVDPIGLHEKRPRTTYEFTVAVDATAVLTLPIPDRSEVREGDGPARSAEGVREARDDVGGRRYGLGSGTYRFVVR